MMECSGAREGHVIPALGRPSEAGLPRTLQWGRSSLQKAGLTGLGNSLDVEIEGSKGTKVVSLPLQFIN